MTETSRRSLRERIAPRIPPLGVVLLVLVSYVPLLLTKPGKVGADTKTYLYLDPGRLLERAAWMWDPNVGLGTVTHQNIGYLWPLGPYYWLMETLGLPDWMAQRLWLGSIILAAGLGVRFMLRELRWVGGGLTVAAFAYALSPYLLDYAARLSVILLPFAGLPWLIGLAARALRRDDWRTPAAFALVTLTVGGVNATSLLLVMVGPLLWFLHAVFVEREVTLRRAVVVGLRISGLTLLTSLWWMAGLALQGTYGIPILRYTETYETVASAALSTEIFRGLGYWFFYGRDGLGAWTRSTTTMLESVPALALSFAIPVTAAVSGLLTRWRHRIFFAAITAVGLVISVGSHPWDSPSPYGALFKAWSRSDLGLSFRSTPRAVPLVALGLAVFLAAGVAALARLRPKLHLPVAGVLVVLVCLNSVALFRGQMVDENLMRDENVPAYWLDAAQALEEGDHDTRVLEVPGIDFASYRWGNTVDPITPGLTDREYVARELIPYGTPPAANLLNDVDLPFQDGRLDPDAVAPLARMMGVGQILHRADLQFERYRSPRPRQTADLLNQAPGLGPPLEFGEPVPNESSELLPLEDEGTLAATEEMADPAPVTLYPVLDPRDVLRTVSASAPTVLAGDAAGIVSLASVGRLQADRPLLYSAAFADDPDRLREVASDPGAELVVTDTNRRQARRWGTVRENDGRTERAGEEPLEEDVSDNRLDVFPEAGDDARTVTEVEGPVTVSASAYGNGITYTAGDRAVFALDGDPATSWRVAAFDDPVGEYLRVISEDPLTADHVDLLLTRGFKNRWITEVSLVFDAEGDEPHEITVPLTEDARAEGQRITFDERTFRTLDVVVEATNLGEMGSYRGASDVGIAELTIPGVDPVVETIRPPVDLLEITGEESLDRPLTYLFTLRSSSLVEALSGPEESSMRRWVEGPVARSYTAYGTGRLSDTLTDTEVDRIVGLPSADEGGVDASSSGRMPRDLRSRASAAVDGDTSTAYRTPFGGGVGSWVELTYPEQVTTDGLELTVVADGQHSVPTSLSVSVDGGAPRSVPVPPIDPGEDAERRSTTTVRLDTGELRGTTFRVGIESIREVLTKDWFSGGPVVFPVGIAELGLPTVEAPAADAAMDDTCRTDLVDLGGDPVGLRVVGTVGDALASGLLDLEACGGPIELDEGRTLLRTAEGAEAGIEVNHLALSSAAGGAAGTDTVASEGARRAEEVPAGPSTSTERPGRNSHHVEVREAQEPYWIVLGQSHSEGWTATTSEGDDLGEPTLINGFANGWLVDPEEHGADLAVDITWTPQRLVWVGLALSAVGVLLCLVLILWPRRRGRTEDEAREDTAAHAGIAAGAGGAAATSLGQDAVPDVQVEAVSPTASDGPAVPPVRSALVALVAGLVTAFFAGLPVGLVVAVVAFMALWWRHGQVVLRSVVVAALVAATGFVVLKQWRNGYEVDFSWPKWFETTHAWTLAGVLLLALDPVVSMLRGRERSGAVEQDRPDGADRSANGVLRDGE